MGVINFTSSTSGSLSGTVENAIYKTNDGPGFGPPVYVKDAVVSISPMNDINGFIGGSKLTVNGIGKKVGYSPKQVQFILNAVATNGGNTLFFMSAPTNTSTMNGACQKV